MSLKKVIAWLVFAFVVISVIKSPDHAAHVVRIAGNGLGTAVAAMASFVGSLL